MFQSPLQPLRALYHTPARRRTLRRTCLAEPLEVRRLLATITVTSLADNLVADQMVTLREAILAANTDTATDNGDVGSGADVIVFDPSLFANGAETILLQLGELDIADDLTISGLGADTLTISGDHDSRVFRVRTGVAAELSGLTISNGAAAGVAGGGIINFGTLSLSGCTISNNEAGRGGGIFNGVDATLSLNDCVVADNVSHDDGGGVLNRGTITVTGSSFVGNHAADAGGGLFNDTDATMTISDSTLTENSSNGDGGGGVFNYGTLAVNRSTFGHNTTLGGGGGIENFGGNLTVSDSTVHDNDAVRFGGGILNNGRGTVTIVNSTISGNSAGMNGGGISNFAGELTVINCTVVLNRADADGDGVGEGGGITTAFRDIFNTPTLHNTIVAGNVSGSVGNDQADDVGGVRDLDAASSHNLIGDSNTSGGLSNSTNGNIVGAAIEQILDLNLQANGGATATHALVAGSVAIDGGSNFRAVDSEGNSLDFDQRGLARVIDGDLDSVATVDIGAFESGATQDERLNQIVQRVNDLVAENVLNKGRGNALQVKLQDAQERLDGGQVTPAVNQLQAFVNQVEAFVRSGKLSPADGQALTEAAEQVIAQANEASGDLVTDSVFANASFTNSLKRRA